MNCIGAGLVGTALLLAACGQASDVGASGAGYPECADGESPCMHVRACRERAHSATCPVAARCDFSGPRDALARFGAEYRATCAGDWGTATVTFTPDPAAGHVTGSVALSGADLEGTFPFDGTLVEQDEGGAEHFGVEYAGGTCPREDAPVPEGEECVSVVGAFDVRFVGAAPRHP
jgi:hypothetical protein